MSDDTLTVYRYHLRVRAREDLSRTDDAIPIRPVRHAELDREVTSDESLRLPIGIRRNTEREALEALWAWEEREGVLLNDIQLMWWRVSPPTASEARYKAWETRHGAQGRHPVLDATREPCPECAGSGMIVYECSACGGRGVRR
jgi:hypothetical protein